jgi:hypothetical protein
MRKFRFVGDPTEYETKQYGQAFKVGEIYDPNYIGVGCYFPVKEYTKDNPHDWQPVFEEPKPLLKDTDLGYFAGLAMQSILHDPNWITDPKDAAKRSVEYAKALIEELNKQQ